MSPGRARQPVERRLAIVTGLLLIGDLAVWALFTERTRLDLSNTLFWSGALAVAVGVAIVCGAWRGFREPDTDLILGPSLKRTAQRFRGVTRAYADLNVLALAGCIALIASVLVYEALPGQPPERSSVTDTGRNR